MTIIAWKKDSMKNGKALPVRQTDGQNRENESTFKNIATYCIKPRYM